MAVAALITEGIGPGGSVAYLLTGGLDSAIPVVHNAFFPAFTLMRSTPVAASGLMVKSPVPSVGAMSHTLPAIAFMGSARVPSVGAMSNSPVASEGAMP